MSHPILRSSESTQHTGDGQDISLQRLDKKGVDISDTSFTQHDAKKDDSTTTDALQIRYQRMSRSVWMLFVLSIISPPFLFSFDLLIVATLQPRILKDLGQVEKLPWISVAYALASLSSTLLWGKLYTLFNIKWIFALAFVIFEAGCAVSGVAHTMNVLIGGRVLSGFGAVGIYSGLLHTLAVVTTMKQRPLYISLITLAIALSAILGPIIGGVFADSSATWRWGFYINLCIGGLFVPFYLRLFPPKSHLPSSVTLVQRFQKLDILSNVLWAGACATILMAISLGGTMYAWNSGQIIGLFVASTLLWILFGFQQWQRLGASGESPVFPTQFLRSLEMCFLFIQVAVCSAAAQSPLFLIPLYFQFARGSSALTAGGHLLPLVGSRSVFVLVNGFLMRKYGYVMPWFLAGSIFCLIASALFLTATSMTSSGNIYGYAVLLGIGVGLYNQAPFAIAQARVTPELVPQAVSFITLGQIVGIALSLAVANSIFINRAISLLTEVLPNVNAGTLEVALSGGYSGALTAERTPDEQLQISRAIVTALDESWASILAACAVSVVCAVLMKRDRVWK